MEYTKEDYLRDQQNPNMDYLKDRVRFRKFYEHQGKEANQLAQQYVPHRTDWITPTPGGHILELGCHVGFNLIHWLTEDQEATGIGVDVSENLLKEARKRADELLTDPSRVQFVQSFIEDYPTNEVAHTTDIVLTETLEHVQDVSAVLDTALSIYTKSNATLWISCPAERVGNYAHVRGINDVQLSDLLRQKGIALSLMDIQTVNTDGYNETRCRVISNSKYNI